MKSIKFFCLIFSFCVVSAAVRAAVAPEYADNSYSNHELTRAEKKCLDEGYKITYANCSNQTAPGRPMPASQILLPHLLSGAMVPQQQLSFFERGL